MPLIKLRGFSCIALLATLLLLYLWTIRSFSSSSAPPIGRPVANWRTKLDETYFWKTITTHYPPDNIRPLPINATLKLPKVQTSFRAESAEAKRIRQKRQRAVKETFAKCWESYRKHAWTADELTPVSGGKNNNFGGWAATLVDSLDTLWIMGMRSEFDEAVKAAAAIDFTDTTLPQVNVFETNIRYLGGFLSAFDLSGDVRLLRKAAEVGEMLYKAFDTPNRMPVTRWDMQAAKAGKKQVAQSNVVLAEIGSLSLEFTHLSQLTGDPKWFDAIQRITEGMAAQQSATALPGLWPITVDAQKYVFTGGETFSLGAMADSAYEYLPKMSALMGGQLPIYRSMYENAVPAAVKHNLFRPMTPKNEDILISGIAHVQGKDISLEPQGQHLVCFLGGLMALAGKLFDRPHDLSTATKLVDGCVWVYNNSPNGVMPEDSYTVPCESAEKPCEWDEAKWKQQIVDRVKRVSKAENINADDIIASERLPKGFIAIPSPQYLLRPEAIESVFILYRITGRVDLIESAWTMFNAINNMTSTQLANSAVRDVRAPKPLHSDAMESFWFGETLKYFYLVFSETNVISLDEYVFNTEAHPFRRLVQ